MLPAVFPDEYLVRSRISGDGLYIRDVLYGNRSALYTPFLSGSALGDEVQILIAHDGGKVSVRAQDKEGNPVPGAPVAVFPAGVASPQAIADAMVYGLSDQNGLYESPVLAPGKYLAIATERPLDLYASTIEKIWRIRTRAEAIELAANGNAPATVRPMSLD